MAPLLSLMIIGFCLPLAAMLYRAIDNPEMSEILPETTERLLSWTGYGLPDEALYGALAHDLKAAQKARTTGLIGKRINYEFPGARSKFLKIARKIEAQNGGPWKATFLEDDPQWGDEKFWAIMRRAAQPLTVFYLLSTLDLRLDAGGAISAQPPEQAIFVDVFSRTLWISFIVTAATLVLGYPVAYFLASLPTKRANLLLMFVLIPFFTSILVRTTAWVVLLQTNGVINDLLILAHLTSERIQLIYNRAGTLIAMTYIQLPFTLLPIYSVMKGINPTYMRAARSLGAGPVYAFTRVYIPQTMPGISAGCLLTFILSLGYYITPALVGGPKDQMVSYFVALYTNVELNWGLASALGCVLLVITLILYSVFNKVAGLDKLRLN